MGAVYSLPCVGGGDASKDPPDVGSWACLTPHHGAPYRAVGCQPSGGSREAGRSWFRVWKPRHTDLGLSGATGRGSILAGWPR